MGAEKQITSIKAPVQFGKDGGTALGPTYLYNSVWSPDSTKILWADKKMRLLYVDIATKAIRQVAQGKRWEIRDYVWSPDSRWIAYARPDDEALEKIWLYSLDKDKATEVTDGWYESNQPCFSGDGKYLFFVSERDFKPLYSDTEWNHAYTDMGRVYFVTLAKDTPSPFAPKSDDDPAAEPGRAEGRKPPDDAKQDDAKKDEAKKKPTPIKVDLDGLKDRIVQLPIPPANYGALQSVGATVYYMRSSSKGPEGKAGMFMFDLATKKETSLGTINGYEISANGQKMLVNKDGDYAIIDLPKGAIAVSDNAQPVGLAGDTRPAQGMAADLHRLLAADARLLLDPNMHGVDWKAMRDRYEPLVEHVNHRADLTYVIGEMISELNAGHAYVGGGDYPASAADRRRPARGRTAAGRKDEVLQDRQDSQGIELGAEISFAAQRDRRRRRRGGVHHRRQRPAHQRNGQHLRSAGQHRRQTGPP